MNYIIHLVIIVCFYIMLSQSLNLTAGFGGMISLVHAGFYGIGAYTTALLSVNYHLPFLITISCAILICGLTAMIISGIILRTIDDYFVICTIGIQVILFSSMNNCMSLTNGPLGIVNIPPIRMLGFSLDDKLSFLILTIVLTCLVCIFLKRVINSAFGRILRSLREDEIYTQSIGKNVYLSKVTAFTLSAMLATIPGVLYAHYISYIDPTSFTIDESIFILSIVIIGGSQNMWRSIVATAFLVLLPEVLRFIGFPSSIAANIRQIIYGVAIVFMMFKYCQSQGKNHFSKKIDNCLPGQLSNIKIPDTQKH